MKHFVSVMMSAVVLCASLGTANAVETKNTGWFLSSSMGVIEPHKKQIEQRDVEDSEYKSKSGLGLSVGLGKQITPHFSSEVTYSHSSQGVAKNSSNTLKVTSIDSHNVMLNSYFNLTPEKDFSPYLMVGVGVENTKLSRSEPYTTKTNQGTKLEKYSGNAFAYQAGLGVSYKASSSWNFFAGASIKDTKPLNMSKDDVHLTAMSKGISVEPIKLGFTYTL